MNAIKWLYLQRNFQLFSEEASRPAQKLPQPAVAFSITVKKKKKILHSQRIPSEELKNETNILSVNWSNRLGVCKRV